MTKLYNISCLTTLGLLLTASPALMSQASTGQISGKVTDTNGRPLRARVTLTAPQLMGQRDLATNEAGEWLGALLPVGDYTIRISADGHIGRTISNVRVGVGAALRHDTSLRPVAMATDTVEITADDTTIADKTDTRTAVNYSSATLLQIGTFTSGTAGAIDRVFGQAAGASVTGTGRVIRGSNPYSVSYRLNGSEITNPWANTDFINAVMSDQIEDMAVVLSPTNARYGRVIGGGLDIVTKSGGNVFTGSIRLETAARSTWGAKPQNYSDNAANLMSTVYSDGRGQNRFQINVGGPIIKNRLWFAIGARTRPTDIGPNEYGTWDNRFKRSQRTGHAGIDALLDVVSTPIPGTNRTLVTPGPTAAPQLAGYTHPQWPQYPDYFNYKVTEEHWNGKLTWAITPNHSIEVGGHKWGDESIGVFGMPREEYYDGGKNGWFNNDQTWNVAYNAILGSATFLEAKFSRAKGWSYFPQGDGTAYYEGQPRYASVYVTQDNLEGGPYVYEPIAAYVYEAGNLLGLMVGADYRNSTAGGINLTMYRKLFDINHNIDVGVDYFQGDGVATRTYGEDNARTFAGGLFEKTAGDWLFPVIQWTGGNSFGQRSNGTAGLAPLRTQYYGAVGERKNRHLAFYVNDQMTINDNWNVMLGLRYDTNAVIDIDDSTLLDFNSISPRFTVTYDPKGDSSNVFKFSYMRVQQEFHTGFVGLFTQASPTSRNIQYVWTGAALPGGQPLPGTENDIINGVEMYGLRLVTLQQLLDPNNYGNPRSFADSTRNNTRDSGLTPPVSTEYAIEYRRNYEGGSYFRTAYVYRALSNFVVGRRNYHPDFWVVLDTQSIAGQDLGLRPMYSQTTHWFNTDDLKHDYHGFEFETHTRLNSIFTLRLNYTFSQLRGNYEAGDTGLTALAPQYNEDIYLNSIGVPMDQRAPFGSLNNDRPHNFAGTLLAVLPLSGGGWVSYSAVVSYLSGTNWNITRAAAMGTGLNEIRDQYTNPNGPSIFDPATTWTRYYAPLGAYHWNDNVSVNFNIAWEVSIWKKLKAMGNLSVSNVFNMVYHPSYNNENDAVPSSGTNVVQLRGDRFGRYRNSSNLDTYANGGRSFALSMGIKF